MRKIFREITFRILAVIFSLMALYHIVGVIAPTQVISSPMWRHGLFATINLLGVGLILWRPAWLVFPFFLTTLQQLYSHGHRAWVWWNINQRIDWISFGVILIFPFALILLIKENEYKKLTKKAQQTRCIRPLDAAAEQ